MPVANAPAANNGAGSAALAAVQSTLQLEQQVQQMANQGLTVNQIASNLDVSVSTVQLYLATAQPANANAPTTGPGTTTTTHITI
jgi:DNA-binding NarL/FixJ family response regulator